MKMFIDFVIYLLKVIAGTSTLPTFAIIAHYVFNMPKPKYKHTLLIFTCISSIEFVFCFDDEYLYLLTYLVVLIYILYCTKYNLLFTTYIIISVLGIIAGTSLMSGNVKMYSHNVQIAINIYEEYYPIILIIAMSFAKNWRENFDLMQPHRKYDIKHMLTINFITCTQLFAFDCFVAFEDSPETMTISALTKCAAILTFILSLAIVAVIIQFRKKSINNTIANLSNRYLNAEVEHFKAYEKTQIETRRIRHDMKNHLFSLEHLLKEGNVKDAKDFIHTLKDSVDTIDTELHTGNTLADVICNDKSRIADSYGIKLSIDGTFPKNMQIENVDLCTILGNSLDNAINATNNLDTDNKWIEMDIRTQGDMLFLSFSNPIDKKKDKKFSKKLKWFNTKERDFGLHNIKYTLKKYKGFMGTDIINENDTDIYVLNNLLIYT